MGHVQHLLRKKSPFVTIFDRSSKITARSDAGIWRLVTLLVTDAGQTDDEQTDKSDHFTGNLSNHSSGPWSHIQVQNST